VSFVVASEFPERFGAEGLCELRSFGGKMPCIHDEVVVVLLGKLCLLLEQHHRNG
jgi:hypothetical protein